jgi:hypothetical protein
MAWHYRRVVLVWNSDEAKAQSAQEGHRMRERTAGP